MHRRVILVVTLTAVLALVGAACGGDDDEGALGGLADATEDSEPDPAATDPLAEEPEVEIPKGDPPSELVVDDLTEGDGRAASGGSTVEVHYVGVLFDDGTEFDSSYDRGTPFSFTVGAGEVIQGWEQGVEGMKVGGMRRLVIPPDLAYGDRELGPIPPGSTLVFVVELLSVQ